MDFLLISNYCSKKIYEELFKLEHRTSQQYQKYMRLIMSGLSENGASTTCVSVPPVNRKNCDSKIVWLRSDSEKVIRFKYVKVINLPMIRNICAFFGVFFKVLKAPKKTICIQDLLNVTTTVSTFIAARLSGKKILGILTDMPNAYVDNENQKVPLQKKLTQFLCEKCADSYLFLTKEMNDVVNKSEKPYVIIEGFSDYSVKYRECQLTKKTKPKSIMYAGGINKLYGLDMLVNGFIKANLKECELHIYGNGPFVEELKKICKEYSSIKYLGTLNNEDILEREEAASLLVNPRYTSSEFVKYSFPSKNMEYMSSGTPVLTTKLPGMPKEYYEYVYILLEENEQGMADALSCIMVQNDVELYEFGKKSKNWILENKNNIISTRKIINLFDKEY